MAGKAASGFLKLIGLSTGDDEQEFYEEEEEFREEPVSYERGGTPKRTPIRDRAEKADSFDIDRLGTQTSPRGGRIVQHPSSDPSRHCVMFYSMVSYTDTSYAIDDLLRGKSVHVNLDQVEQSVAQRILDTLSGASYALHGDYRQTAKHAYFFAPQEIELGEGSDVQTAKSRRNPYNRGE